MFTILLFFMKIPVLPDPELIGLKQFSDILVFFVLHNFIPNPKTSNLFPIIVLFMPVIFKATSKSKKLIFLIILWLALM